MESNSLESKEQEEVIFDMKEYYKTQEKHSLIVSSNDKYNNHKGEYEVISKTIKDIILYLSTEFTLFNYYKDYYQNKENVENYVVLKKLLNKDIVVFEPLNLDILNDEYILELSIIGLVEEQLNMNNFNNKEFNNITELEEFLLHVCKVDVFCQVYDSNYIEVNTSNFKIIERIKEIL